MREFKPFVESLETRANPSTISLVNRVVYVQGDAASNVATVEVTPSDRLVVTVDRVSGVFNLDQVQELRANLGGGKDQFLYMNGVGVVPPRDDSGLRVSVNAGSGDDVILVEGSSAQMLLCGSSGNDIIDAEEMATGVSIRGGAGNDLLVGGTGNDSIFGGAGADVIIDDVGQDTVDGGAGSDQIISADGRGAGSDTIYYDVSDVLNHDGYDTLILV